MPGINDSKCVLVIGATAGIGRALALAIHDFPSKPTVIVAGRRQERLVELLEQGKAHGKGGGTPGRIEAVKVDVTAGREQLKRFVGEVLQKYPELDTIILSAGVQHQLDFTRPEKLDLDAAASEVNINYVAVLTLIALFLPHLLKISATGRPTFIVPITSGLAIMPQPSVPNYCATKAALHSLCVSLQKQLTDKNVHVLEIVPPLVESELHDLQGTTEALSKHWMPLDEYTSYTIKGLQRGDAYILVPTIQQLWDKFEKPKLEFDARRAFISK